VTCQGVDHPFLIHNRLYRFPCESVSVIKVPSPRPGHGLIGAGIARNGYHQVEDQSTVWQKGPRPLRDFMPASSNADFRMSDMLRSDGTLTVDWEPE